LVKKIYDWKIWRGSAIGGFAHMLSFTILDSQIGQTAIIGIYWLWVLGNMYFSNAIKEYRAAQNGKL
jgi:hypothetical protein